MRNTTDILNKYTKGEATLEETNEALRAAGANLRLDPNRNALTDADKAATTVGWYPNQANGFGLLDTGTGTLDKVKVQGGKLVDCDMGESLAMVYIAGKTYYVQGRELTDKAPKTASPEKLPKTPDMRRREDLAGQTVVQRTLAGKYNVTYDELGYAMKATKVEG